MSDKNMKDLIKIKEYLEKILNLQEFSNQLHTLNNVYKGDGAGLSSGTLIDKFSCEYYKNNLDCFTEYHKGESDLKLFNIPLSLKKITGCSEIALNWSKNATQNKKPHFTSDFMIINLQTEQWWKSGPRKNKDKKIIYNKTIPSGIYLIDKDFCKNNINLSKTYHNKSNSTINKPNLYKMLYYSIENNLFIKLPDKNKDLKYSIINGFN